MNLAKHYTITLGSCMKMPKLKVYAQVLTADYKRLVKIENNVKDALKYIKHDLQNTDDISDVIELSAIIRLLEGLLK